jgi:plasmid stabilization system protein ParE
VIVVWTETALEHLAGIRRYISQTSAVIHRLTAQRIEVVAVVHSRRADIGPTP